MAMTVDSKPLISMLQQLSGKQAQSQQCTTVDPEIYEGAGLDLEYARTAE